MTTAGGIEEDFIKCLAPTYLGEFSLRGKELRKKGINRIGNLLVPNDNYCKFEDWIMPILDSMLQEQKTTVKFSCSHILNACLSHIFNIMYSLLHAVHYHYIIIILVLCTLASMWDME